MGSKRKVDMGDAEFEFLHDYLVQLSKINMADAKSMLLFIRSFSPNSQKLRLVEYEMAKDSNDIGMAAHLLTQLFASGRELLSSEVCALFDGLKKSPPDKVSLEIFTRLNHSTQRDLFNAFFARPNCTASERADLLLYLLGLKEIQSQVQLVPNLFSLAYRALRDGEATLAKSANVLSVSQPDVTPTRAESSKSSSRALSSKNGDGDEGEEGEVLGDDDDEDDTVLDAKPVNSSSSHFKRTLALCEYRRTLAYDLLPLAYQVLGTVKIDRRLLEKMIDLSLNFLYESMMTVSEQPIAFDSERKKPLCSVKPPLDYISDCFQMGAAFLQWPSNLFVKQDTSVERNAAFNGLTLKPLGDLVALLDESFDEVLSEQKQTGHPSETESGGRKHRNVQRIEDSSHSNARISALTHQSVALLWYLIVRTARDHISLTRPSLVQSAQANNDRPSVSSYPLDMSYLFPTKSMCHQPFTPSPTAISFSTLAHLWQYRRYKHIPVKYTLGTYELDNWDAAVRPSYCSSVTSSNPSLEEVVCFDLTLSGILTVPWSGRGTRTEGFLDSTDSEPLFAAVCPTTADLNFLRWLLCGCVLNPFTRKSWTDPLCNRRNFVKQWHSVAAEAPSDDICATRLTETCWLIPHTQQTVKYLGCKVLSCWLCSLVTDGSDSSTETYLNALCFACILSQVDTVAKQDKFLTSIWPSPFQTMLKLLESKWSDVRVRLLNWMKPPTAVVTDSSLINEFVLMETDWLLTTESSQSEFMDACVSCMRSEATEPMCARLLRFVQTESEGILKCLEDLSTASTR